jgi:hypothetical protein
VFGEQGAQDAGIDPVDVLAAVQRSIQVPGHFLVSQAPVELAALRVTAAGEKQELAIGRQSRAQLAMLGVERRAEGARL